MNKQIKALRCGIADARSTLANMHANLNELEKQKPWKALTNYEIRKCWRDTGGNILEFARDIEQVSKEKNYD